MFKKIFILFGLLTLSFWTQADSASAVVAASAGGAAAAAHAQRIRDQQHFFGNSNPELFDGVMLCSAKGGDGVYYKCGKEFWGGDALKLADFFEKYRPTQAAKIVFIQYYGGTFYIYFTLD